jgi:hypothetical protein
MQVERSIPDRNTPVHLRLIGASGVWVPRRHFMASTSMAKLPISVRVTPQIKVAVEQLTAIDRRSISEVAELA